MVSIGFENILTKMSPGGFVKIKNIVLVSILGLVSVSQAENACVQRASSRELVDEISRRLNTGGGGGGLDSSQISVIATCRNWDVTIDVTNLETGETRSKSQMANSSSACQADAQKISRKAQRLTSGGIVAICSNWDVHIITITKNGTLSEFTRMASSGAECIKQADAINE